MLPEPPRTDPLRVLKGIALIAVTFAALSFGLLSCRTQSTVDDADQAIEEIRDATERVERDTRDLDPTLDALREAAKQLREIDQLTP